MSGNTTQGHHTYRQHLLQDGNITAAGNKIRIPLQCLSCRKEPLQAMFAERFPDETVIVESTEHQHAQRMRHIVIEFEPKNTDTASVTKLFVALRDAGVYDIERTAISMAFQKLGRTCSENSKLATSELQMGRSAIVPLPEKWVDNSGQGTSTIRHF